MKVSKVIILAAVMLFAGSAAGRTVLQVPPQQPQQPMPGQPQQPMPAAGQAQAMPPAGEAPAPQQCQNNWKPESIKCTFQCPTGNWEFNCEAQAGNVATCNVKREKAESGEATYFLCLITAPNQPPNCQQGIAALNVIPDQCVTQNVNQIVGAWPATPPQG